jgi:hypothetical protein
MATWREAYGLQKRIRLSKDRVTWPQRLRWRRSRDLAYLLKKQPHGLDVMGLGYFAAVQNHLVEFQYLAIINSSGVKINGLVPETLIEN